MSETGRGLPDPDPGEMADRLQRRANQLLALENLNMELGAKLGEAEHQLVGAVMALVAIREQAGAVCPQYETCKHPACQASYAAWALASRYLEDERGTDG